MFVIRVLYSVMFIGCVKFQENEYGKLQVLIPSVLLQLPD